LLRIASQVATGGLDGVTGVVRYRPELDAL